MLHVKIERDGLACVRWLLMKWHNAEKRTPVLQTEYPRKGTFSVFVEYISDDRKIYCGNIGLLSNFRAIIGNFHYSLTTWLYRIFLLCFLLHKQNHLLIISWSCQTIYFWTFTLNTTIYVATHCIIQATNSS